MSTYLELKNTLTTALQDRNLIDFEAASRTAAENYRSSSVAQLYAGLADLANHPLLAKSDAGEWLETKAKPVYEEVVGSGLQSSFAQFLISNGLVPGEDFSADNDGNYVLQDKAKRKVETLLPPDLAHLFLPVPVVEDSTGIEAALSAKLGVPFLKNLLNVINFRIGSLTPGESAYYINEIERGVSLKTGIKIDEALADFFGEDYLINLYDTKEWKPCAYHEVDILAAAGGGDAIFPGDEAETFQITDGGCGILYSLLFSPY